MEQGQRKGSGLKLVEVGHSYNDLAMAFRTKTRLCDSSIRIKFPLTGLVFDPMLETLALY